MRRKEGHMNRNNPFSFIWIFFLLIFIFGSSGVFPLIFLILMIYWIYAAVKKANAKQDTSSSGYQRSYTNANSSSFNRKNSFTPAQLSKVNVYLRSYYQSHASMPVLSDIDLRISGKTYNSLSSLDVYRNGRFVCSLNDFGRRYPDMYAEVLKVLVSKSEGGTSHSDIFDADVQPHTDQKPQEEKKETAAPQPEKEPTDADGFLNKINSLNEDIPDKEISDGLFETCALLKQISALEKKFPASKDKLDKLYQYYLPILVKVLKQYDNLQVAKTDPSYEPTRTKLNSTIKLINEAMKTIISSLTDSDFINLSADMSTLEAVLQKDGLAGDNRMSQTAQEQKQDK